VHSLISQASPDLNRMTLSIYSQSENVNFDSCLDLILGLHQLIYLYLDFDGLTFGKIRSSLKKQGVKKRWEVLMMTHADDEMNDTDILEICFHLPSLREWRVLTPRYTLTVEGVREWTRICPLLKFILVRAGGLSEEVVFLGRGGRILELEN
jgi:hypothetical protein